MSTTGIETGAAILKKQTRDHTARLELKGILHFHQDWVNSNGKEGQKAMLAYANLVSADLAGANLQGADLQKANLNWAVLVLANLKNAFLFQASLQDADLLGAELQGAHLQGASLATATGLSVQQLAGTNLSGALLPRTVTELLGREQVARASRIAGRLLLGIVSLSFLAALLIASTRDAQLATNFTTFPIPFIGRFIPVVQFYLVSPLLLLGLQIYFHFYLQRLWEGMAGLPAVFPDGKTVDHGGSRMVVALGRFHLQRDDGHLPRPLWLEAVIAVALAYWLVPVMLFFLWARYLTRQDMRGSMLQVFAAAAAAGIAVFIPQLVDKTYQNRRTEPPPAEASRARRSWHQVKAHWRGAMPAGTGLILMLLTLGTIHGVPHDTNWVSGSKPGGIAAWSANIFWMAGYDPYPVLTEATVSTRPPNWSWRDEDLGQISGAWLNQSQLRYLRAYRAFLPKGRLWESDLRGAFLSEADLRQANLRQVNLDSAVLDHA
ncbi:MAG: pentapeptide repeat-containing protein, partial [Candidatus Acidiferrales bacterium]